MLARVSVHPKRTRSLPLSPAWKAQADPSEPVENSYCVSSRSSFSEGLPRTLHMQSRTINSIAKTPLFMAGGTKA